jgi:hypothetical protein
VVTDHIPFQDHMKPVTTTQGMGILARRNPAFQTLFHLLSNQITLADADPSNMCVDHHAEAVLTPYYLGGHSLGQLDRGAHVR